LSSTGLEEAKAVRQRLAAEKIDVTYCSDLERAVQTAKTIAFGRGIELVICKELREIDFGEFEGLTFDEVGRRYPDNDWWTARDAAQKLPQGESVGQLAARVDQFISARLEKHTDKETILIVAHGGSLRTLVCRLLGLGLEHWWQIGIDSASLTIMQTYPRGMMLSLLNDTCHLKHLRKDSPW
jgi:broad specificity phosphatase PhoE